MKFFNSCLIRIVQAALLSCVALLSVAASAVTIPPQPLSIQQSAKPMIMLALGRDHRMFYEAYNDASDIDGDGNIDIRFKPSITYLGLFDSKLCYSHSGANDDRDIVTGQFSPAAAAGELSKCTGMWSGNWLNYVTTSRIDALRVVMFGGMRDVDTSTQTVLRRAYIPRDAHSWAKEYTSTLIDGYLISDYTPLAQPNADRRHFFGSLTRNADVNCDPISACSSLAPWLSVIVNSPKRVWEWASTERPVLSGAAGGTRTNFTVRVEVCTSAFNSGCKLYPNGNYKPVGLLHDFGENDAALFGMFSGSYDSHLSGGRLRKSISSFQNELNTTTGVFDSTVKGIVHNFNSFRLFGFNRGNTSQSYAGGVVGGRVIEQGEFPDWGNPIAEQMYEAVRYLANKGSPTSEYNGSTTIDDLIGLTNATWDRPYKGQGTSIAEAPYCSRASLLTISDTNISFDSNQLPGVNASFGSGITTDLTGVHINTNAASSLNVSAVTDFITANEANIIGTRFIGQSGTTFDSSPTVKSVTSLSNIRGLAPEEPTKQGSYYSASVAHYAKSNDLNSGLTGKQTIDSYFVALASPLPRIEAKLPNGKTISLVPFSKSIGPKDGCFGISPSKSSFQPSNQIVDFYVESIANTTLNQDTSTNGGRYQAKFRVNFEDVEQGNDHDMDAIVIYTVSANADNTLDVTLQTIYQGTCAYMRMGYIVSGSTADGTYLVTQNLDDKTAYFLNVPPGRAPNYCNETVPPADCYRLPYLGGTTTGPAVQSLTDATSAISQFVFSPSTAAAGGFLKDPLWYAAKWGGFSDANNNGKPDLQAEWDQDGDGLPDTYFFVQNPTKLRESLTRAFRSIVDRQGSSSNLAANVSGRIQTDSLIYRASYVAGKWNGDVEAIPVTINGLGAAPAWNASAQLPAWESRALYMQPTAGTSTIVDMRTTAFSSLPTLTQSTLTSATIYSYLRGNQSNEAANGGSLRSREKLLGDIIHSSPAYDLESQTLYVGSNGGFLHAFNGVTGQEKFGFMPAAVVPRARNIASLAYSTSHEYFVDGENLLGYKFAQTNNSYYLYTMLGRGGKGMFSLNPGVSATVPTLLWDYTAPLSTLNNTSTATIAAADPDLGLMLSSPLGTLLNNGKFAVVAGNGYNSTSGKAVLYIFIINADGSLDSVKKIDTGIGGDNGLSGPAGFDVNNDGKADFLYAGDLKGNLWKFDVRDPDSANWRLAYASGAPMFKATDSAGTPQPITVPPTPVYNNYVGGPTGDKLFLYFGTGSYFKIGDNTDLSKQTWYGILDDDSGLGDGTPVPTSGPVRSSLVQRLMSSPLTSPPGFSVRYAGGIETDDMLGKRGWYIDFLNPVNGERIINPSVFLPQAVKPTLLVTSFFPINNEVCVPGGDSYTNAIDPFTGANLKEPVLLAKPATAVVATLSSLVPVGPVLSNPSPLTGAQHVGLHPSSLKLNVGIATTPINLGTGGAGANSNPWDGTGNVYGSTNNSIQRSDFSRWNSRVATKTTVTPPRDCVSTLVSVVSGSEGIESSGIAGCDDNKLKGRISWREILKD